MVNLAIVILLVMSLLHISMLIQICSVETKNNYGETRNISISFSNATIYDPHYATRNDILPRFVLRAGPGTTGTTTIQTEFGK